MNEFLVWFSENVGKLLILLGAISIALLVWGIRRMLARRQERPRRGLAIGALVFSVLGIALTIFISSQIGSALFEQTALIGKPAPELSFRSVADDAVATLDSLRGRVVLLNLWATWCPPCREEMPGLDRLHQELEGRGLAVVHLSDETRETLIAYLEENPTAARHVYADGLPWPEWGRPTSFVIDRGGRVRKILVGPRTTEQFRRIVEPLL